MEKIEIDKNSDVQLSDSKVEEFKRLNFSLQKLLKKNQIIFKSQKEFTENASHEMQTPLAIFQSKLDILLQSQGLTEDQFKLIHEM
jgi:signal transduction histidine kinase